MSLSRVPALFLLAFSWIQPNSYSQTKRAVVIGINKYNWTETDVVKFQQPSSHPLFKRQPAPGDWKSWAYVDLQGAIADAELMKGILVSQGFEVLSLYDNDATAQRILDTLQKQLVDDAAPGDFRVVYYSGHGAYYYNQSTTKSDHLDQTLVPADHWLNTPDIRDKELARILYASGKKGVVVTMFADSCNSGSLERGPWNNRGQSKTSTRPGTLVHLDDPGERVGGRPIDPKDVNVLFWGASQPNEEALETSTDKGRHGAFTWALSRALEAGAIGQNVDLVFRATLSYLQNGSLFDQQPTLVGNQGRLHRGIFGQAVTSTDGIVALVEQVDDDGVRLRGGVAIGIRMGAKLKRIDLGAKRPAVTIEITGSEGLAYSRAKILGSHKEIRRGDVFQVVEWVAPPDGGLRVFVPRSLPFAALRLIPPELSKLRDRSDITLLSDYSMSRPTHVVYWTGEHWEMVLNPARAEPTVLGPILTEEGLRKYLPPPGTPLALLVILPPPFEILEPLTKLLDSRIEQVGSPAGAQYWLHGRSRDNGLEYAWIGADAGESAAKRVGAGTVGRIEDAMPTKSDWTVINEHSGLQNGAFTLADNALRLTKIRGWMTIANPADTKRSKFPWHLALMNSNTKGIIKGGIIRRGERYKVCLQADQKDIRTLGQDATQRWVYVFVVDQHGKGSLVFPDPGVGNVENHLPFRPSSSAPLEMKPLIVLTGSKSDYDLEVSEPYGVDSYILVTSEQSLPPNVFNFDGVNHDKGARGVQNPLVDLISDVGTRGVKTPVPTDWGVERLAFKSVER
jgi:hypothetical protein